MPQRVVRIILLREGGRPQAAWIFAEGRVVRLRWVEELPENPDEALELNAWKN